MARTMEIWALRPQRRGRATESKWLWRGWKRLRGRIRSLRGVELFTTRTMSSSHSLSWKSAGGIFRTVLHGAGHSLHCEGVRRRSLQMTCTSNDTYNRCHRSSRLGSYSMLIRFGLSTNDLLHPSHPASKLSPDGRMLFWLEFCRGVSGVRANTGVHYVLTIDSMCLSEWDSN